MNDAGTAASAAVETTSGVVDQAARSLAERAVVDGRISVEALDRHQVLAYDLAHAASAVEGCRVMLEYAQHGELEANLAYTYIADAISDVGSRLMARDAEWGVESSELSPARDFVAEYRAPSFLESVADSLPEHGTGPAHLPDEFDLVRDSFHRFAADKIRPVAEHIHRENADIPEDIISGLAELGGFGLSVPEEYGGFASGGESDYLGDVRSPPRSFPWDSPGAGGALITRPEILDPGHREGRHRGAEARLVAADRHR